MDVINTLSFVTFVLSLVLRIFNPSIFHLALTVLVGYLFWDSIREFVTAAWNRFSPNS